MSIALHLVKRTRRENKHHDPTREYAGPRAGVPTLKRTPKTCGGGCRGFGDVSRGVRGGEKESHLLQFGVGGHAALGVALRQLKHAVVEAVEAGQRHKLERVPQLTQSLHTTSIN